MTDTVIVGDIDKAHKNAIAELVQTACRYESHIGLNSGSKSINAKSLMGIMAFGLAKGMTVNITTEGSDEQEAMDAVKEFLS